MKLKLIIVLIAIMLKIAVGSLCEGQSFYEVKAIRAYMTGLVNYFSKYEEKELKKFKGLDGLDYFNSEIIRTTGKKLKNTRYPLSSNLVFTRSRRGNNMKCLLEYIIIEDNIFYLVRIKFKYPLLDYEKKTKTDSCGEKLKAAFASMTCKIEDFDTYYHTFSIAAYKGDELIKKPIKFNTKIRKFILEDGEVVERGDSAVTFFGLDWKRETAELTIKGELYATFTNNETCLSLLKKIQDFLQLETCTINDNIFNYFYLIKEGQNTNSLRVGVALVPQEGKFKLINNIIIDEATGGEFTITSTSLVDGNFPEYDKYNVKVTFYYQTKNNNYSAIVNLNSEDCFERFKKLSEYYQKNPGSIFLTNYKQGEGKILHDLDGDVDVLRFDAELTTVEEYNVIKTSL
jgi:hypothetical protein